jgi:hypothetical protein
MGFPRRTSGMSVLQNPQARGALWRGRRRVTVEQEKGTPAMLRMGEGPCLDSSTCVLRMLTLREKNVLAGGSTRAARNARCSRWRKVVGTRDEEFG